jgi:N-acetylglutamate synthase/N-acetylornithine aminotransferase
MFDRLDTDGSMSTNDTVLLLASRVVGAGLAPGDFTRVPTEVCTDLARQLQTDQRRVRAGAAQCGDQRGLGMPQRLRRT